MASWATSDPDYTHEEVRFLQFLEEYKAKHRRLSLTTVEIARLTRLYWAASTLPIAPH